MSTGRTISEAHKEAIRAGQRRRYGTLWERFFRTVTKDGPEFQDKGRCWMWHGVVEKSGYGRLMVDGRMQLAHRIVMTLHGNQPPQHLVVDHMCQRRLCVNPAHLRIVTRFVSGRENNNSPFAKNAQKTHCPSGHPYEGHNVYLHTPSKMKDRYGKWMKKPVTGRLCNICYLRTMKNPTRSKRYHPSLAAFLTVQEER
jgi:hypothetical protein